jgi:hypothetical protein
VRSTDSCCIGPITVPLKHKTKLVPIPAPQLCEPPWRIINCPFTDIRIRTVMTKWETSIDEIKVKSNQLVDKVKELIQEGNARKVSIRKDGRTLLEFPLTMGVGGATAVIVFTPILAAVGALAALVSDVDVVVEREIDPDVEIVVETDSDKSDKG